MKLVKTFLFVAGLSILLLSSTTQGELSTSTSNFATYDLPNQH
jgi:hypothetical protein